MLNILYNIVIYPIEYLISALYQTFLSLQISIFAVIFLVSYSVTLICLPFYIGAENIKAKYDEKLNKLAPDIKNIKDNFKGSEQFFLLKTLYKQNNWHPIMSLIGSFGLLIQIPFFIASYIFFSQPLVTNLAEPDGLLNLFGLRINLCPIIMTIVNIIACELYIKNKSFKSRIQPYSLALIFLVLLYNSPSILVIYWTFNNILFAVKTQALKMNNAIVKILLFSLAFLVFVFVESQGGVLYIMEYKLFNVSVAVYLNILLLIIFFKYYKKTFKFIKEKYNELKNKFNEKKLQYSLLCLFIIALLYFYKNCIYSLVFSCLVCFISLFAIKKLKKILDKYKALEFIDKLCTQKEYFNIFMASCICLIVIQGFFISTNIISKDPNAFSFFTGNINLITKIIYYILLFFIGVYIFWLPILYYFSKKNTKNIMSLCIFTFVLYALINYFTMGKHLGTISTAFIFEETDVINIIVGTPIKQFLNLILFFIILSVVILLIKKFKSKSIYFVITILIISQAVLIGFNTQKIYKIVKNYEKYKIESIEDYTIDLSKKGKNVIVIFLDRFLATYLPVMIDEKPGLKEIFSGFTFYPNTVSFYGHTILGYPPMVGGYEYTPFNMEKDERSFGEKFNEASMVLLKLFKNNGYTATVSDPEGDWDINLKFRDNYKDFYTNNGIKYLRLYEKFNVKEKITNNDLKIISTRYIGYSYLNISPKILRKYIYNGGQYKTIERNYKDFDETVFEKLFPALYYLPNITTTNAEGNTFTLIHNAAPHYAHWMRGVNYDVLYNTYTGEKLFEDDYTNKAYHSTIACLLQTAKYINYLKKKNVYDNSRIIIVSDHSWFLLVNKFKLNKYADNIDAMKLLHGFNPLLMVKDFNEKGRLKIDNTFMTNADTPYLATQNLIKDARNPFTGNPFSMKPKENGVYVYTNHDCWVKEAFLGHNAIVDEKPIIYFVSKDVFNYDNWIKMDYKNQKEIILENSKI